MNELKLKELSKRAAELENFLVDYKVITDQLRYGSILKEYGLISPVVRKYREYLALKKQKSDIESSLGSYETELAEMAKQEIEDITRQMAGMEPEIDAELEKLSGAKKDPDDAIVEIRAGAGGKEAALFAADMLRMYLRYCEKKNYKTEIIDSHPTGLKGFKEVIFTVEGKGAFSDLKYESGTHRVQRVPQTEASGRIHTSTVTVAVLPEADEISVEIRTEDLRIDTFRASGHGGQHLQKTDSAVRITHVPTGITAQCQDERSQIKNREKAMKLLRARLFSILKEKQEAEISSERRGQIGGAKRSEKIRTYNFPQNRVTDHRVNYSIHNLKTFIDGDIDDMILKIKESEVGKNAE
jgi:peptide chain release factor 1